MLTVIVHHENTSQNFNRKLDHLGYVGYHQKTKRANLNKHMEKGGHSIHTWNIKEYSHMQSSLVIHPKSK